MPSRKAFFLRSIVGVSPAVTGLPRAANPKTETIKLRIKINCGRDFRIGIGSSLAVGRLDSRRTRAGPRRRIKEEDLGWSHGEGAGLREFHQLLREADKEKTRAWGGLRRVSTPANDVFWVCPNHYTEYEKGLPKVP